jgi:hypothetical protein
VTNATGEIDRVCLEFHARTATITQAPTRKIGLDILNQQGHARRETLEHPHELRAV